jgi:hypothetical protein
MLYDASIAAYFGATMAVSALKMRKKKGTK